MSDGMTVGAGGANVLSVSMRNLAASEIRGEAQVLSPLETWQTITPWTQGFVVAPGEEAVVDFEVRPPVDVVAGTYWALIKVMYFGRLLYSESVPFTIVAPKDAAVLDLVAGR
jgi:hypothetical protein